MLSIMGFAVIVIATYYSYKTARDYGRNRILWALLTFSVGFGLQLVLPFFIGMALAIVWMASRVTAAQIQAKLEGPAFFIGIGTLVLSFIGMGLILRFLSKVPEGVEIPPAKRTSGLGLDN